MLDNNPPENHAPNFGAFMHAKLLEMAGQHNPQDPIEADPRWEKYEMQKAFAALLFSKGFAPGAQDYDYSRLAQDSFVGASMFFAYQEAHEKHLRALIESDLAAKV